ncbi:MAG TPA: hypothetical protein VEA99_15905 [Gemmatimonadaceae bacterium]|nr:hypothetical protein [Gemmatimonadaceae bacterium]
MNGRGRWHPGDCLDPDGQDSYSLDDALASVGPGWADLVRRSHALAMIAGVRVIQVKEKFGGLRVYTEPSTRELSDTLEEIEAESFTVCESCGAPGDRLRVRRWWMVRCPRCQLPEAEVAPATPPPNRAAAEGIRDLAGQRALDADRIEDD